MINRHQARTEREYYQSFLYQKTEKSTEYSTGIAVIIIGFWAGFIFFLWFFPKKI